MTFLEVRRYELGKSARVTALGFRRRLPRRVRCHPDPLPGSGDPLVTV